MRLGKCHACNECRSSSFNYLLYGADKYSSGADFLITTDISPACCAESREFGLQFEVPIAYAPLINTFRFGACWVDSVVFSVACAARALGERVCIDAICSSLTIPPKLDTHPIAERGASDMCLAIYPTSTAVATVV